MNRYCYTCGSTTTGDDVKFCNKCSCSFDVKLCPRFHENPREAECCSQCGSKDLSTPQRKIPVSWQLFAILIRLGLGLLLFYASLKLLEALLLTPGFQQLLIMFGALLCGLWLVWSRLPDWMREALRSFWRKNDDE
jgi:hypothetical protein